MSSENTHVHIFTETVVPPTCRDNGYTLHKCECGYEHKDAFVPATGAHAFTVTQETAPTCTVPGSRTLTCTTCGLTQTETAAPLGHQWGAWNVQTFATCTAPGSQYRFCTRCGQREEQPIPPTNHQFGEWIMDTVATCTEPGSQYHVCMSCGHREDQPIPPVGHSLTAPKKSETHKGMVECFCERCGETVVKPSAGKKFKKFFVTLVAIIAALGVLTGAFFLFLLNPTRYFLAKRYIEKENYEKAYDMLYDCGDYKDSKDLLRNFRIAYEKIIIKAHDENGDPDGKLEIRYDKYGNETSYIRYDSDGSVEYERETKYEYDKDGNIEKEIYYNEGTKTYQYEYEYDKNGNMTSYICYDSDGNVSHKYEYERDKHGNVTKCVEYDDENGEAQPQYTATYEYDGDVLTHAVWYNAAGNKTQEWYFTKDGDCEQEIYYDENGNSYSKYEYEYKYDKNGNVVQRVEQHVYGEGEKQTTKWKVEYDENGVALSAVVYDNGKKVGEATYSDPIFLYDPENPSSNNPIPNLW